MFRRIMPLVVEGKPLVSFVKEGVEAPAFVVFINTISGGCKIAAANIHGAGIAGLHANIHCHGNGMDQ
ncbi:MAG: hypothetical protein HC867_08555 [Bacteroidia bacterium]|nr:hypothetical protein [Bacteroidia bacterium]